MELQNTSTFNRSIAPQKAFASFSYDGKMEYGDIFKDL